MAAELEALGPKARTRRLQQLAKEPNKRPWAVVVWCVGDSVDMRV